VTADQVYKPVAIEVGRADENPVELQASWATLQGDAINYVFRAYDWDTIDGWKTSDESAGWKIDVVQAGDYEVTVSYGASHASAGSRFRISIGDAALEGTVEPTPQLEVFHRRVIGTIRLQEGSTDLQVRPVRAEGSELMALNRIWLRRQTP
jgi:hypothetical protein